MDEGVLRWFRERVRTREYVMTVHAEEEMAAEATRSTTWSEVF